MRHAQLDDALHPRGAGGLEERDLFLTASSKLVEASGNRIQYVL